jgi:hypothetical protein
MDWISVYVIFAEFRLYINPICVYTGSTLLDSSLPGTLHRTMQGCVQLWAKYLQVRHEGQVSCTQKMNDLQPHIAGFDVFRSKIRCLSHIHRNLGRG